MASHANKCCIVITTTDNKKTAELIAKKLIESKLAACVQIDDVHSFFYYDQKPMNAKEVRLWIKANNDNYKFIEDFIKLHHNYQLPQIVKIDVTDGLPGYIDWVCGN